MSLLFFERRVGSNRKRYIREDSLCGFWTASLHLVETWKEPSHYPGMAVGDGWVEYLHSDDYKDLVSKYADDPSWVCLHGQQHEALASDGEIWICLPRLEMFETRQERETPPTTLTCFWQTLGDTQANRCKFWIEPAVLEVFRDQWIEALER